MRNLRIPFVTLILAVPALLAPAQVNHVETFERGFRPHVAHGYISSVQSFATPQPRAFYINRVGYRAWMAGESIKSSPDWTPSKPMPIAFEQLAQAARQELAKLVDDDSSWSVTSFQLHSIPEEQVLKWYCVIEMKPFWEPGPAGPEDSHDSFCAYIDLSGRPGFITRQYADRQK
jgi:hypothetical protein